MGAYSILYWIKEDTDTYAVDWDWQVEGKWARSWREYGLGQAWHVREGGLIDHYTVTSHATTPDRKCVTRHKIIVREEAYQALLGHFGLEEWKEEFPPEKIITMSPAKLAAVRREKEKLHGLKRIEMFSATFGDYRPAEEFH